MRRILTACHNGWELQSRSFLLSWWIWEFQQPIFEPCKYHVRPVGLYQDRGIQLGVNHDRPISLCGPRCVERGGNQLSKNSQANRQPILLQILAGLEHLLQLPLTQLGRIVHQRNHGTFEVCYLDFDSCFGILGLCPHRQSLVVQDDSAGAWPNEPACDGSHSLLYTCHDYKRFLISQIFCSME